MTKLQSKKITEVCMRIFHNKDIIFLSALFAIFAIVACTVGHVYGSLFVDCGRELWLPEYLLQGHTLDKNVFWMYNPLSYQINTLLYAIFGVSLNTIYGSGYVASILIIVCLYLISRKFLNSYNSFVITLFIMVLYVIYPKGPINYIFPYSYAMVYATLFFNYSILSFLHFMQTDRTKSLFISTLLFGFSFACKPDYILCIIPIFIVCLIRKVSIRNLLIVIGIFFIPFLLSWGILFLQGMHMQDIAYYLDFTKHFFNTPEQIFYNQTIISTKWAFNKIISTIFIFISFTIFGCLICRYIREGGILRIIAICSSIIYWQILTYYIVRMEDNNPFVWVSLILIIVLTIKTYMYKFNNGLLYFLSAVGLLSMYRIGFYAPSNAHYGIYTVLPILALYVYFINTNIKIFNRYNCKLYTSIVLIVISLCHISICIRRSFLPSVTVKIPNGTMRIYNNTANVFNNLVEWINQNTKEYDSILVMPEGVIINFATKRPTKPMYYHLIPNHISALGENNIVIGLEKEKPNYIITTNNLYNMYNKDKLCTDFGMEICQFINKNYTQIKTFSDNSYKSYHFSAKIYKLK